MPNAFCPSGTGDLVPEFSGKDETFTCSAAGYRK